LLALAIPLGAPWAQGKDSKAKVEGDPKPAQGVNWQGQVVKATGAGAPDVKASSPAQARLGAERAATLDAFRNLLAQVKGIQISAGKTVSDAAASDEIKSKVEGIVKGYKIVGKRYFSDGGVEVDVEVPLAALTEVFDPEPTQQMATKTEGEKTNTGLVIDARGLKVSPALAPRVLDDAGKALYSVDSLSADARKATGVASYVQSLDEAKKSMKAGDKPLIVKAVKANGTDLQLGSEDMKKLATANTSYLAEGRVVIVLN
jgi:hypothetical protein